MSRTIPPTDPESTASPASRLVRDAKALSRPAVGCSVSAANPGTLPRGLQGFGSGFMPGIVRGMDAAAEAHKDVFMAVPGMNPEPKPLPRWVGEPVSAAR
jgi:hypothetical protein